MLLTLNISYYQQNEDDYVILCLLYVGLMPLAHSVAWRSQRCNFIGAPPGPRLVPLRFSRTNDGRSKASWPQGLLRVSSTFAT